MLDWDPKREHTPARDAATLVVVRAAEAQVPRGQDATGAGRARFEVFCVERRKAGFLGGAIVFPGGKLEAQDLEPAWIELASAPRSPPVAPNAVATTCPPFASDGAMLRGLAVAACREALEEAAILPLVGAPLEHAQLLEWRARIARRDTTLRALLEAHDRRVDLAALRPLARWVTPVAESRRFDARFYLFAASRALVGAHDDDETTASFWAPPAEVLRRFVAGEHWLAPPTHRILEMLAGTPDADAAMALADGACLAPVCPRLIAHRDGRGETLALALPGDPEHEVAAARSPGKSRYVLRGDRFFPEDAPV